MMTNYAAGFVVGLLTGVAAATLAWVLANLRSRARPPQQRHLEPLPGPPQLSDHIYTSGRRRLEGSWGIQCHQPGEACPRQHR